jgi:hypothetical protein
MAENDLRHFPRRRGIEAALGADDAVDDGYSDAGEIAETRSITMEYPTKLRKQIVKFTRLQPLDEHMDARKD